MLLVLAAIAAVLFVTYRIACWQIDREYAEYRQATIRCFDAAVGCINQGDYAGAQRLVSLRIKRY